MSKKKLVPNSRFEEFKGDDEWEEKKLGEMSNNFEYGLNAKAIPYDGVNQYIRITDIDEANNQFMKNNITSPDIDTSISSNYLLEEGDILFARTGASVGKTYMYRKNDGKVYYAGFLIRARIKNNYDTNFIFYNTLTKKYDNFIRITSQRSGQPGVNSQQYASYSLTVPKFEEQRKIGEFFKKLDSLINLQKEKLAKSKDIKSAYLSELFPKEGEKYPKMRFEGFTEPWELMRINEIANIERGLTYSPKAIVDSDGVRVLRSSNIVDDTFVIDEDDVFVDENAINIDYAENKNILITSANGSPRLVGKHAILEKIDRDTVHGGFMMLVRTNMPYFFNASMSSDWYRKFIKYHVSGGGGSIGNIKKTDLENHSIFIPSLKEQEKIGSFFKKLDDQIKLEEEKLAKLEKIKEAYLNDLFV